MPARKSSSSKKSGSKKASSRKTTTSAKKRSASRKSSKTAKRTVIEPRKGDRRYVRRNKEGEFKSSVDVGRSLSADRRRKSKTKVPKGQGDRGETSKPGILKKIFG